MIFLTFQKVSFLQLSSRKRIIMIRLSHSTIRISQIHHITMRILHVVGIIRLRTIGKAVSCRKARTTDVALCLVILAVDHICNDLLAAIPDMVNSLTVYSLFGTQSIITSGLISILSQNQRTCGKM